jgi:hypothetical protein
MTEIPTNSATSYLSDECTPMMNGVGVDKTSTRAAGKRGM